MLCKFSLQKLSPLPRAGNGAKLTAGQRRARTTNHRSLAHLSPPRFSVSHPWSSSVLRTTMKFSDLSLLPEQTQQEQQREESEQRWGIFQRLRPGKQRESRLYTCMLDDTSCRSWGLCFCSNLRNSKGMFPEPEELGGLSEARVLLNCSCTHCFGQGWETMKKQWLINQSRRF